MPNSENVPNTHTHTNTEKLMWKATNYQVLRDASKIAEKILKNIFFMTAMSRDFFAARNHAKIAENCQIVSKNWMNRQFISTLVN